MSKLRLTTLTPHKQTQYWSVCAVEKLFETPFLELVFQAAKVHRDNFDPREVQLSTLLSIKTGGCPEDCTYCPQSARYNTGVENEELLAKQEILEKARIAKSRGATRFCMGAAWRGPKERHMKMLQEAIMEVKALGMEVCGTFGILEEGQAEALKEAGLDYYNHNLDTAPEHYHNIITTRKFDDRINTLGKVRSAGLKVCCGGIIGLNETRKERAGLLASLANLDPQPESVPINQLVKVEGTPLFEAEDLDWTEFVRTIAVARIIMPQSHVRLSAGRQQMPESMQALCFMAGANSIFYGEKLLTTANPDKNFDAQLLHKLDLKPEGSDLDFATILEQQETEITDFVNEHGEEALIAESSSYDSDLTYELQSIRHGGCGSSDTGLVHHHNNSNPQGHSCSDIQKYNKDNSMSSEEILAQKLKAEQEQEEIRAFEKAQAAQQKQNYEHAECTCGGACGGKGKTLNTAPSVKPKPQAPQVQNNKFKEL